VCAQRTDDDDGLTVFTPPNKRPVDSIDRVPAIALESPTVAMAA
jgi:hypothetical protein